MVSVITKYCKPFSSLCPWLCAYILCRDCWLYVLALCLLLYRGLRFVSFVEFLNGDSRNPSCGESGNLKQGARTRNISLYAFGYLTQHYSLYISQCYYCSSIHAWYCTYTYINPRVQILISIQEFYWSTLTLNLEESCKEVLEPFARNSVSLFGYHLWLILLV